MPALDNPRWEKFCEYIISGATQIGAYAAAFGNDSQGAAVNASKLIEKQPIQDRLMELRKLAIPGSGVLTLQEKRAFLRSVVTTAPGAIDEDSHLCQSFKKRIKDGETTLEYELPNKLKALELDAKLAGELNSGGAPTVRISMYAQAAEVQVEAIDVELERIE